MPQLQRHETDLRICHTYNAEVNAHMIAVNELLGYQPSARPGSSRSASSGSRSTAASPALDPRRVSGRAAAAVASSSRSRFAANRSPIRRITPSITRCTARFDAFGSGSSDAELELDRELGARLDLLEDVPALGRRPLRLAVRRRVVEVDALSSGSNVIFSVNDGATLTPSTGIRDMFQRHRSPSASIEARNGVSRGSASGSVRQAPDVGPLGGHDGLAVRCWR